MPTSRASGSALPASTLSRAKKAGEQMRAATESLNAGLRATEQFLVSLDLGVTAAVGFPLPGDGEDWERYLRFGKFCGRWQLTVEQGSDPSNLDEIPLANCSRETRAAAVEHIAELAGLLVTVAEREASVVAEKASQLNDLISSAGISSSDDLPPSDDDIPF